MKVTNYEISKKLKEIGFEKLETDFCWININNEKCPIYELVHYAQKNFKKLHFLGKIRAYDLETILEALPETIRTSLVEHGMIDCSLQLTKRGIGYNYTNTFHLFKNCDESLADTAARLLILLHEKGLIKFNGGNDDE